MAEEKSFISNVNILAENLDTIIEAIKTFDISVIDSLKEVATIGFNEILSDLIKNNYLGNRKLDIDISRNKIGIADTKTYEEALSIWNNTSNTVYYNKATCTFIDGTVIVVDFVNDDDQPIQVSTHGAIIDQLMDNVLFTTKLENTALIEEVGGKTGTLIRVVDVTGTSSNVERIQLHSVVGAYVTATPIYYWALTTSALQTLANRIGDIIALGNDIDKIIVLSSRIDEMLELQASLAQLMAIHSDLREILQAATMAQVATDKASIATTKATEASNSASIATTKAVEASNSAQAATLKANEIKNVSVEQTITGASGTNASVIYNPTTGKFTFVVPQGLQGLRGEAFTVNATGLFTQRSTYDAQPLNFSFLATDTGFLFFKKSNTSGDWSNGIPFGKGEQGDPGVSITGVARTTGDGSAGTTDTYTIYYSDATTSTFEVYNGADSDLRSVAGRTGDVVLTTADIGGLDAALASVETALIVKPVIVSPVEATINYVGAISATYTTAASYVGVQDYAKWECATDASFSTIVDSYEGSGNLTSWSPSIGLALTTVYVRVKQGSDGHLSAWSDTLSFTTPDIYIITPSVNVSGDPTPSLTPTITTSSFSVFNDTDTHVSTDWQIIRTSDSVVVWESLGNTTNLLSIVVPSAELAISTQYIFRAKHNSLTYGSSAYGEKTLTTVNIYIQNPTITVTGTPSDVTETPTLTTSAFSVHNGTDTHASTDWQITQGGSVIWESLANSANKLSITVPSGILEVSTAYVFRARHNGGTYGSSAWVEVSGTTKSAFAIPVGIAGTLGFGVAPSSEPFALLGLSEMTGTNDVASDNYGNYQHTNGSIMVHVPKFYYRVGNASAPQYATYGANTLEIVGTDTFGDEASANAAGYALHRAFIDGGAVKGGFFIDKYLASKKVGDTNVAVSVKNGNPIGLTTNATYTPSSTMTGCTGILADAVTLSRARGSYFNTASVFMYAAIALLSVAHGQKATSTSGCAWYDASRTMNFPKGCNNGSRADVNDTSVTWSASPDTAAKGLTGSASTFAKSTHNGQNNGIADVNGLMYQVALGMTNIGTSATDTAQIASNLIYLLKQSVALKSLTAGWDGATDAWGNSTHLGVLYDQVTSPIDITNAGASYWGSGANAVFSASLSGVGRDTCGLLPKDNSAYDATGTNMCGGDYMYRYNVANMFPFMSGGWGNAAGSGVFYRHLLYFRSVDGSYAGFRVAAYA